MVAISRQVGRALVREGGVGGWGGSSRFITHYQGQIIHDAELVKKKDDWVIEETNFCLGRVPVVLRHQATDDQARRVLLTIARQPNFMHTRLRDGTCIAPMHLEPWGLMQKPIPLHDRFPEIPLFKYTWDDAYDEMFE
eukprot:GHVN01098881.1.p1 GENE.GHVN01098881.1~~GHVN01098881.1.p1  ORF type:complete len:138 (-),score=16.49 GHVN01098881.1:277-690(-)